MNTSTEIRHRKPNVSNIQVEQNEDVKKLVNGPLQKENSWCSDNFIASLLFIVSLPIRFKHLASPAQVM
jgi:hypothetical protein